MIFYKLDFIIQLLIMIAKMLFINNTCIKIGPRGPAVNEFILSSIGAPVLVIKGGGGP